MTRDDLKRLPPEQRKHREAGYIDGFRAASAQLESFKVRFNGENDEAFNDGFRCGVDSASAALRRTITKLEASVTEGGDQ